MRALNDPVAVQKYVNPEIMAALSPSPTAEELNMYMLEFSERNNIPLEEINIIGHKFTKEWKNIPSVPPVQPQPDPKQMDDFERKIAEEFKNKIINPYNNPGGNNPANFNPYKQVDPNAFNNPNNPNSNPNPYINPYNSPHTPPNPYNSPNIPPNPYSNPNNPPNNFIGSGNGNNQYGGSNPYEKGPANLGPNFYVPADIAPKKPEVPTNRTSINSLNDIDYYPDIDVDAPIFNQGGFSDPSFDQICERLKKGL